ncbi:hypothetical protein YC2023_082875 [Brassica napus]
MVESVNNDCSERHQLALQSQGYKMLSKGSWLVTNQLGGRKILNNYFNLGWIAIIKLALSDAQHGQLAESHLKTNYANGIPYIFSHICTPAVSLQLYRITFNCLRNN